MSPSLVAKNIQLKSQIHLLGHPKESQKQCLLSSSGRSKTEIAIICSLPRAASGEAQHVKIGAAKCHEKLVSRTSLTPT